LDLAKIVYGGDTDMGRKNLLQDLMSTSDGKPAEPLRPRQAKGAIGAVSKSIADLKSRSVTDLHPDQIRAGGLRDRLEEDEAADEALVTSIRDHGQQVPVLVRPHPTEPDLYQIVYGRRRVAALRALGQPVKALIRDLDDKALVIAQGQENAARQDLSFIEKVNFARQMHEAGYDRKTICAALHIDKTVISRMLKIADSVPARVIEAIGPAPSIGRNRWVALADALDQIKTDASDLEAVAQKSAGQGSDAAFEAVLKAADARTAPSRAPRSSGAPQKLPARAAEAPLKGVGGKRLGCYIKTPQGLSLMFSGGDGFENWLVENMSRLHSDWSKRRGEG
jgi:ParB family chromosome partitioning protein